jgi:hypothetical protein
MKIAIKSIECAFGNKGHNLRTTFTAKLKRKLNLWNVYSSRLLSKNIIKYTKVRFQVLTAASMKTFFWDIASCSLVEIYLIAL